MKETAPIQAYSIENLRAVGNTTEQREVDVFKFEYFVQDIDHLRTPHRHNFFTFILVLRGTGSHDIDFNTYSIQPNRLFLISPGQVHSWNELNDVAGFVVLFTDNFVALSKGRKLIAEWPLFKVGQPCYIDISAAEANAWKQECDNMEKEMYAPDAFSQDALFYSIGSLLVRSSRLYATSWKAQQVQDVLFLFQELIEMHFTTKRTPKEYADILNLTPNHLNAIVKKKSGKSAGELIRQRVILEAKRNLAHTQLSVAEIAFQLGFADNSYFGRFFKRYTGITPEHFRKQRR
ncbi:MAG: AraC family transcriptional regulator [Bacteroidota bacterium]